MPTHIEEKPHASGPYPNILIVGGGIAGMTLAFLLEQSGFNIEIIERTPELRPLGGGITLTLNGMKLLTDIGLGKLVEEAGLTIKQIKITDAVNQNLSLFNVEQYAASFAKTITIHRSELHGILLNKLTRTPVHFNTTCASIEECGQKNKVVFSNGRVGYYDLIVGCDGMHSSIRKELFKNTRLNYAGYACWRFVCNGEGLNYPGDELTEMWGKGKRFGIVPLTGNRIHCFASINTTAPKDFKHISLPAFKALFSEFGGLIPPLLARLTADDQLLFNELEDVYVSKWIKGKIILIGDAAHGMTPNLTQGASMAIEDAVYLCNALKEKQSLSDNLQDFFNSRRHRVSRIQRKSSLLGKIGQWQSPVLTTIRNYCWKNIPDKWIQKDFENLLIKNN